MHIAFFLFVRYARIFFLFFNLFNLKERVVGISFVSNDTLERKVKFEESVMRHLLSRFGGRNYIPKTFSSSSEQIQAKENSRIDICCSGFASPRACAVQTPKKARIEAQLCFFV